MAEPSEMNPLNAARSGDRAAFEQLVAPHLKSLKAHCYRMSGSWSEAEDLLQDSLVKAWKGLPNFEGRSAVRTWLYSVATHACLDALDHKKARTLPPSLGGPSDPRQPPSPEPPELAWITPAPFDADDARESPDSRLSRRESVALAFLTVLQRLPPRQRAVVLLRDVVGLQASECAELLDSSVASINSALQRGRETLADAENAQRKPSPPAHEVKELLGRYLRAWEQSDLAGLLALLKEDAVLSMPPNAAWFVGPDAIGALLGSMVLTPGSGGSILMEPVMANGVPGFACWVRDPAGVFQPTAVHVLEFDAAARITLLTAFLDPIGIRDFGFSAPPAR